MVDYFRKVFERRLRESMEHSRFDALTPQDISRILATIDLSLEAELEKL